MAEPEPEVGPEDYKTLRRYDIPGDARALNFSCFRNQPFLSSDRACGWLAEAMSKALPRFHCDLWAYCFMPTHAHVLIFPRESPVLAPVLSAVKIPVTIKVVRWVKKNAPGFLDRMSDISTGGTVAYRFWQRGSGFDRNLRNPGPVWAMIDYMNPVEAGLVARQEDWKWSGATWYATQKPGPLALNLDKLPPRLRPR